MIGVLMILATFFLFVISSKLHTIAANQKKANINDNQRAQAIITALWKVKS